MKRCRIEGCDKATVQRSPLCAMHRSRQTRYGDPLQERAKPRQKDLPCIIDGCGRQRVGRGLCGRHWMQRKRRGDPEAPPLRGRLWTPGEDRHLMDLIREPGGSLRDRARPGEVEAVALYLCRSKAAASSRLCKLKRRERDRVREADYQRHMASLPSRATR